MKNGQESTSKFISGLLLVAGVTAASLAYTSTLARAAVNELQPELSTAENLEVPPLPPDLDEVQPPHRLVFVGHATGSQNYVCLPAGSGLAWTLFTPQATLFRRNGQQLTTHFFSPNPDPADNNTVRAAWLDSQDSSTVWGRVTDSSIDANFVAPGAIPWLTVATVGVQAGPTGGGRMTDITFIQRLNTVGGSAPGTGCSEAADIGRRAFVPYRADYFFFADPTRQPDGQ